MMYFPSTCVDVPHVSPVLGVAVLQPEDTRGDIRRHMLDVASTHWFGVTSGHEDFCCLVVIADGTGVERTLHDGESRIAIPIGTDKMSNDILYWSRPGFRNAEPSSASCGRERFGQDLCYAVHLHRGENLVKIAAPLLTIGAKSDLPVMQEEKRLLSFHALHQDLPGTISVFVDPCFEASVHCFGECPFVFPTNEYVAVADCR